MSSKVLKILLVLTTITVILFTFAGCDYETNGTYADEANTKKVAADLQKSQPTPTDIEYSLERYNLIRRAYWVNGQREKANALPCEIEKPLGYVTLFSGASVVGNFIVDGKVSSLNSFLTPDSEEYSSSYSEWLADVDGTYGENDSGIFFFTPEGNYIEWSGDYLYSDVPFKVDNPVLNIAEVNK